MKLSMNLFVAAALLLSSARRAAGAPVSSYELVVRYSDDSRHSLQARSENVYLRDSEADEDSSHKMTAKPALAMKSKTAKKKVAPRKKKALRKKKTLNNAAARRTKASRKSTAQRHAAKSDFRDVESNRKDRHDTVSTHSRSKGRHNREASKLSKGHEKRSRPVSPASSSGGSMHPSRVSSMGAPSPKFPPPKQHTAPPPAAKKPGFVKGVFNRVKNFFRPKKGGK